MLQITSLLRGQKRRATDVLNAIAGSWLKLRVQHALPLADAPEAHRLLNKGIYREVVLVVD